MTFVLLLAMTYGFGLGLQGTGTNNGSFADLGTWLDPTNLLFGAVFTMRAWPVAILLGILYARRMRSRLVAGIAYPLIVLAASTLITVWFAHAGGTMHFDF
jgi:hypothetical protein